MQRQVWLRNFSKSQWSEQLFIPNFWSQLIMPPRTFPPASSFFFVMLKGAGLPTTSRTTQHLKAVSAVAPVSNAVISLCFVHVRVNLLFFFFLSCKHKMFLWFHFASESFHGCHYKSRFLPEHRYWKISRCIHLWIIVQSARRWSSFQSPSSASPFCLSHFHSWRARFAFAVIISSLHTFKNSLTSLAAHMENFPSYSRLGGGINQSDKREKEKAGHGLRVLQ